MITTMLGCVFVYFPLSELTQLAEGVQYPLISSDKTAFKHIPKLHICFLVKL